MSNMQDMEQPRSQAEFDQMVDDLAIKIAEVFGDGTVHIGVVLSALLQVHRVTVSLLDEDGRRHESFAVAAYAGDLLATRPSYFTADAHNRAATPSPNQKGA